MTGRDPDTFLEEKSCILCGEDSYMVVHRYPSEHYSHSIYETCSWDGRQAIPLSIVKCTECGLVYTRPSFKASALDMIYPEDVVDSGKFDATLDAPKHREIIDVAQSCFPQHSVLVDVGTRYGALPFIARRSGYRAYGLEYNRASVEVARSRGIDYVFQGTLDDLTEVVETLGLASVGIVVLDDVLEHLVDPAEGLSQVAEVQSQGDGLILRQMNWESLGHSLFGRRWYYIQPAAHMYYFDPRHVRMLLEQHGYDVVQIYTPCLLVNSSLTVLMTLRVLAKSVLAADSYVESKPSYLTRRRRSWNDRFTVVARRR